MSQNLVSDISAIISQIETQENPITNNIIEISKNLNITLDWIPEKVLNNNVLSSSSYAEKSIRKSLQEKIKLPFSTEFQNSFDFISILIQFPNGIIKFTFNRKRVFSSTSWIFVSWSIGSSFMLFALTLVFISGQVRPIRRLAKTAYSLGIGREIKNIPISGATEVRLATRSIISMASRIRTQLSERTDMLAGVSHDLRTPLTRLRLQLAILPNNKEIKAMNMDIDEMEDMISGYLSFAKNEGSETASTTNILKLLFSIINIAKESGQNINFENKINIPLVNVKPKSLKRAIENIISNAKRYAKVCIVSIQYSDDVIVIIIDDDGPGILPKERVKAIRPFHRLESSRNKQTGGTGLGLAIASNIMLSHGGTLELLDSPINGLRVKLILPV